MSPSAIAAHRPPAWRAELASFAQLFALCGFAIAQPLLDLFGRNPSQFIFRGADGLDIIQFALVVTFVPPLVLWLLEAVIGRFIPPARPALHLTLLAVLIAVFFVQVARNLLPPALLFPVAAAVAVGAAALVGRAKAARLWLAYAALAPAAFLGLFLFGSNSARLIFAEDPQTVQAGVGNPAPVVVVVFDEFPLTSIVDSDGEIDGDLYPNLAELAGGSHWFRNTTTVSSATSYAVPAIDTGQYPRSDAAPIAADHPRSLYTLLGGAYEMNVNESVTRLCPTNLCQSTGGRRALFGDALGIIRARLSYSGPNADPVAGLVEAPAGQASPPPIEMMADLELNQPERFRSLVEGLDDGPATLHYLHILLPHVPYRHLPSGAQYESPSPDLGRPDDTWTEQPWLPRLSRQRLQLQVAYLDGLVGELIAALRSRGLYDEALIVLTADHGISFEPGGPIRALEGQPLDERNIGDLLWVPLFIKLPGQQQGSVSDTNVETVDILPTIADVLEVALPWPVDGQSVFGPARPDNTKTFIGSRGLTWRMETTGTVEIDGDVGWRNVLAQAVDTVLPPSGEDRRLWRIGPSSELVGASVEQVPAGRLVPAPSSLDNADAVGDVDPASGTVPALLRGSIEGVAPDQPIAVSVNGVIGATAPSYVEDGTTRFAVMVDPDLFRPGANEVIVHRIVG